MTPAADWGGDEDEGSEGGGSYTYSYYDDEEPPPRVPPRLVPAQQIAVSAVTVNIEEVKGAAGDDKEDRRPCVLVRNPAVGRRVGLWFGHNHRHFVEGRDIAGRWIDAKTNCWSVASRSPCPKSSHAVATKAKYGGRRAIPASMRSWGWSICTTPSSGCGQCPGGPRQGPQSRQSQSQPLAAPSSLAQGGTSTLGRHRRIHFSFTRSCRRK